MSVYLNDAEVDAAIEVASKAMGERKKFTFAEIDRVVFRAGYRAGQISMPPTPLPYKALVTVRAESSTFSPTVGSHLLEYATAEECEQAIARINNGGGYITAARLYP